MGAFLVSYIYWVGALSDIGSNMLYPIMFVGVIFSITVRSPYMVKYTMLEEFNQDFVKNTKGLKYFKFMHKTPQQIYDFLTPLNIASGIFLTIGALASLMELPKSDLVYPALFIVVFLTSFIGNNNGYKSSI
jgi:hypothetical protein